MGTQITLSSIVAIAPEIGLLVLAVIVLLYDHGLKPTQRRTIGLLSAWGVFIVLLVVVGLWLFFPEAKEGTGIYWGGMMRYDGVTFVFRVIALVALLITTLFSLDSKDLQRGEYYALLMTATIGFSLMGASVDLIMLYIALETASISLYVLSDFTKKVYRSNEAGMKYFIYGAVASAIMLYGLSLIYGLTQETNIYLVAQSISRLSPEMQPAILLAVGLVVVGLGFKISAVPYHFWAPDVYEGAPTPVTAIVSTASKAAGFAIFLRVITAGAFGLPSFSSDWWAMLVAMSIVTMTLGNMLAIRQTNIKRLLAYSSIAQAGYAMIGLVTLTQDGSGATMFYLIYYMITNIAIFGVIIIFSNLTGTDELKDLSGLSRRSPFMAMVMMIALLSLGGIPPTAGFFGKFFLFRSAIEAGVSNDQPILIALAAIGILNAFIALYYYLGVVKHLYLYRSEEEDVPIPISRAAKLALAISVIGILYLGIFATRAYEITREAASALYTLAG